MIVQYNECKRHFDDEFRSTLCPHDAFPANDGNNNFKIHDDAYLSHTDETMNRIGDWMTTYTGRQFWPLDPRAEEVFIEDIAHALSLICRFGGHCREFYSVAQHSCWVAALVKDTAPDYALAALLHDAAEAYVGDLIRPIKRTFEQYHDIEARVQLAINDAFGLNPISHASIKWADNVMLKNEHRDIIQDARAWQVDASKGPTINIVPCSPAIAESNFLSMYRSLINNQRNAHG